MLLKEDLLQSVLSGSGILGIKKPPLWAVLLDKVD